MSTTDRRTFLKLLGAPALAAGFPADIARALLIPANSRTRTIKDVAHIVILMQENRSFDHYFGTMRGVRGFSDPRAAKLPTGEPVWQQPYNAGSLLPFRPNVENLGATFLPDPPHGWNDTHAAWNDGRYDRWVPNKGVTTMTYHTRRDLPYHFALADAFTICDSYHCSVMGPTDPNRYHMWSGWVGNDGAAGGPVITNAELGYDWSTYPERLQRAGISWKIYQDVGVGLDAGGFWGWTEDAFIGNYGDNSLLYFHQYQLAPAGTPLADRAKTGTNLLANNRDPNKLVELFRDDVRRDKLPQVSWIVAPEAYSEHPNWAPNYGAWYASQFIDALASNPDVWSRTALFLNFDEEGGFFDHMIPPTPPQSRAQGLSTVQTTNEIYPGDATHPSAPYGLGIRVPLIVISPWSRGGWVNSQLFDHTSLIRFIEARFADEHPGLVESNITPWRRAVVGDLTSAFDFRTPNDAKRLVLPGTDAFEPQDLTRQPDQVPVPPSNPNMPGQEPGVRPARPLPYALHAHGERMAGGSFRIEFANIGQAAAVFQVRSANPADAPRSYTVEAGKSVADTWPATGGLYDLSVYGPNGFFREFKGRTTRAAANIDVRAEYDDDGRAIALEISNTGAEQARITIGNGYTQKKATRALEPGEVLAKRWTLAPTFGWYDLTITVDEDAQFAYRAAGHVENGEESISDPAMGRVTVTF
jgi:phospholipase C